jgi:hypothetical protein
MNTPRPLRLTLTAFGLAISLPFLLGLAGAGVAPASAEPWLHIKVVETGSDAETVRVNVPLSLVEAMVPLMEHSTDGADDSGDDAENDAEHDSGHDSSGHHHHGVRINQHDLSPAEMRALLEAFRKAEDGEYIAVDGAHENVRVSKSGGDFLVDVDDHEQGHEQVKVRIRTEVLDALLSGGKDELNFQAAARALRNQAGQDLVSVTSEDETVRIWIDEQKTAD